VNHPSISQSICLLPFQLQSTLSHHKSNLPAPLQFNPPPHSSSSCSPHHQHNP
jgi:hypothetical protein